MLPNPDITQFVLYISYFLEDWWNGSLVAWNKIGKQYTSERVTNDKIKNKYVSK